MPRSYKTLLAQLGFQLRHGASQYLLTEADVQRMEAKLGYPLPQGYRQFLQECPDMVPLDSVCFFYNTEQGEDEGGVLILYGSFEGKDLAADYDGLRQIFDSDENCTLETYPGVSLLRDIDSASLNVGWPEELLPIGVDPGGNDICIAFKGLRPGAIFLRMANPLQDEANIYFVADSFDEFIHKLRKCE